MDQQPTRHGLLVIVSGPSGVGKTTITHEMERQLGARFSVSMTTRPQAARDVDGVDYHFVSKDEFEQARENDQLLEWAQVFDHYYGTPRKPVEEAIESGGLMILDIDVQGARQIKEKLPEDCLAIFLLPPTEELLLQRLRERGRDDEATIQRRFAKAKHEMAQAREGSTYDAFVTNDRLDHAVQQATAIVQKRLLERKGIC